LGLCPFQKKNFPNPFKKPLEENLLGKRWNYPILPFSLKKKTLLEKKRN